MAAVLHLDFAARHSASRELLGLWEAPLSAALPTGVGAWTQSRSECLLSSWWLLAACGVVWHQLPITATSCSPSFMKGVCLSAEQTFTASRWELYTLCCCQVWAQSVRVLPGPQGGPQLSRLLAPGVSWPVILLVSLTFTTHIWL